MKVSLNIPGIIASRSNHSAMYFPENTQKNKGIPIGQIIRCEAEEEITHFYLSNCQPKEIKIFRSIKNCEEYLQPFAFFRVHKTHLVNLSYIKSIVPKNANFEILLLNGDRVPLARRKKKMFFTYIEEVGYLPFIELG